MIADTFYKPFYKQIISSANILFTTSNSGIIEELIKNNIQFDWTIMEESGKASGNELISPLLLSHRRLMIGDHKQLPPFSETVVNSILERDSIDYSLLIDGISNGSFKTNLTRISGLDELSELMQSDELDNDTITSHHIEFSNSPVPILINFWGADSNHTYTKNFLRKMLKNQKALSPEELER